MRRTVTLLACLSLLIPAVVPVQAVRQPVRARQGMVVAMEALATDVGVSVLQKGGNAVDAAVAVGFALAVTHPFAGNIGGGGYMLIRLADGRTTFIDFREQAPGRSTRDMYLDAQGNPTKASIEGWRSSGVPGTVRGLELANTKYGTRSWADNLAPAIELATRGFAVSYPLAEGLKGSRSLAADPESKRIFQRDGRFFDVGETLVQPELGRTLQRIAANGPAEFYEGETARRFADEMARHGGLITVDDLRNYKAVERTPLKGTYRNYTVITAPPSSSGGIALLEMLGILEGTGYEKAGAGSAAAIHYMAEAMRLAYADRNEYIGDPDFVKVPIAGLLDKAYLARLRATIDPLEATPSVRVKPGQPAGVEKMETTHYSVVDSKGNAVAVTYTLNGGYGNGITVPGLGFLLNNEMDDFSAKPGTPNMFGLVQGERNAIVPGKRPLSSMTPTILEKDGRLFMTVGAPGGSRISTAVLQVILNVVDFGMTIQDAIDAPRVHHQWMPDRLSLERAISPDTVEILKSRGYEVDYNPGVVLAQTAAIVSDGGWLQGGSDGRSAAGKAAGY
ncbi:MAG: gamma-glutamyltransferase [Vicinamibacterales bacterium]